MYIYACYMDGRVMYWNHRFLRRDCFTNKCSMIQIHHCRSQNHALWALLIIFFNVVLQRQYSHSVLESNVKLCVMSIYRLLNYSNNYNLHSTTDWRMIWTGSSRVEATHACKVNLVIVQNGKQNFKKRISIHK